MKQGWMNNSFVKAINEAARYADWARSFVDDAKNEIADLESSVIEDVWYKLDELYDYLSECSDTLYTMIEEKE